MIGEVKDSVDKWCSERRGKFTASENYKLFVPGVGKTFGEGAMSYITSKALEKVTVLWQQPKGEFVESLMHGNAYEIPAYERYIQVSKNYDLTYLGGDNPVFIPYSEMPNDSGGSPDCVHVLNGKEIDFGVEIKCPFNPMNHFERLKWKTEWDVYEKYKGTYIQIQNLMLVTGAKSWDFVSFDERFKQKEHQIKIITIKENKKVQDKLHFLLRLAVAERDKLLKEHLELL